MPAPHLKRLQLIALVAISAAVLSGCVRGSTQNAAAADAATVDVASSACPQALGDAQKAVKAATATDTPWNGPTTGPKAQTDKLIVYVASTMTNPGVAGVAAGVQAAGSAIGWDVRILDGQGDQATIQSALGQAIALNPAGIVIGGFDPKSSQSQVDQATAAGIPLIGWHAVGEPGPSTDPKLFTNVTIAVDEVSKISAQWIIAQSGGTAGVVVFTDNSIPFAAGKAKQIEQYLGECAGVKILDEQNIPIPDAGSRTPQAFSSLASTLGDSWTYSVAINDLYYDNAATPLRAAGKQGGGAPFNVGAGDGSPAAFQRIAAKEFQAATVPEPLTQEGWQIVDEFNRAFAGEPASGYAPEVHVTDTSNVGSTTAWDPTNGYQDVYKKIWAGSSS